MADWRDEMIPLLRNLLNDVEDPQTYADDRLEEILVVAAQLVKTDVSLNTIYTIDITQYDISPDPTKVRDDDFINFVALRAACIVDTSSMRSRALAAGIRARCGPASIQTDNHLRGFLDLLEKGPCALYQQAKFEYKFGNPIVRGILSPFRHSDFDPRDLIREYR